MADTLTGLQEIGSLPPCGDIVAIRPTGWTIANAATLAGWVNITNTSLFTLFALFTKGSLTSADISIYFALTYGGDVYLPPAFKHPVADGRMDADGCILDYRFTASRNIVIPIPNPGAPWIAIYTSSVGTTNASGLKIDGVRGWGSPESIRLQETYPAT